MAVQISLSLQISGVCLLHHRDLPSFPLCVYCITGTYSTLLSLVCLLHHRDLPSFPVCVYCITGTYTPFPCVSSASQGPILLSFVCLQIEIEKKVLYHSTLLCSYWFTFYIFLPLCSYWSTFYNFDFDHCFPIGLFWNFWPLCSYWSIFEICDHCVPIGLPLTFLTTVFLLVYFWHFRPLFSYWSFFTFVTTVFLLVYFWHFWPLLSYWSILVIFDHCFPIGCIN